MQSEDQSNSDSSSFKSESSYSSSDLHSDDYNESESESDKEKEEENHGFSLHKLVANNDVEHLTSKLQSQEKLEIDLNKKNKYSRTALHFAAVNNKNQSHFEVAEILLKNGADPNAKDISGKTPLWYLVKNCNLNILSLFLKYKANFHVLNSFKESLLTPATRNFRNLDVLRFLVQDIGLNINHRNENDWTPLVEAARKNKIDSHYEVLKCLLEMGADVNFRDKEEWTPLYWLVGKCNWRVVELFLNYQADVHAVTEDGNSMLFSFDEKYSDAQVLDKFINEFGLDVNLKNAHEFTPLLSIMAQINFLRFINIEVVKCFLKNGANVNALNKEGATPLIKIVHGVNRVRSEQFFLENKTSLDFLLEQTDFGEVHNKVHIFDYNYYGNQYEDEDDQSLLSYLWKWILEYLAKLKFLSIPIHLIIQEFIENHTDYRNYFKKCTKELEFMSNTKPQSSWINFFNLLMDNRRKLKNYAGNRNLIQDYENNNWLEMIPIYGSSMKKNVEKALRRKELFDKSSILLSDCLPIFNPNHLIITDILDCII